MTTLVKLAARNIWRNRRRTLITAASILFAVFFSILMTSIQRGTWGHMVDSVVRYHFGYVQIHKAGFWEDRSIDNAMHPEDLAETLSDAPELRSLVPRIESFALASLGSRTKGALVIGIDPSLEDSFTSLRNRVAKGSYLANGDDGVLIAEGLAEYLDLQINDTLVLISQGYHGTNAAGKYPVKGMVHLSNPELNKQMIYMELAAAQWFYGAEGLVTTLVADLNQASAMDEFVGFARSRLDTASYEIMDYTEMLPDLIQARELDLAGGQIFLLILYLIVSFGIFGTLLMMVKERSYEFGILKAIGMRSSQINIMLWLETMALGLIGCCAGVLFALPIIHHLKRNPIRMQGNYAEAYEQFGVEPVLPASTDPQIFIMQALTIFAIISLLSLYPILKIMRLEPVKAMRN
ncbi:MAG: FtsX-like permease family protein [Saprospiraceae bacterium]|nr:FtsX-like permease family protein [Saprospiraceae bacterium]